LEINYYGADPAADYTGYTHDKTLNLYFAQFRFYDPETRRFTQEDPVKDGADWYVYVYDNPLMWVDPLGLYYIVSERGRDGKTYYHAEPQTGFITFKKGVKSGILPEEFNNYVSDYTIDRTGDILSKKFPKIAKLFGSAGIVMTLIQVGSEINSEYKNVQRYDNVIFKLFEIARFTTRTTSEFELKGLMRKAYSFVNSYSDYFFRNVCGMEVSLFEIDVKIKESENAEKEIKSYSDQYYHSFFRGLSSRDVLSFPGEDGDLEYGSIIHDSYRKYAEEQRKKFVEVIDIYDEMLTAFAQALVEHITLVQETVIGPRTVM
jgi:RHS repeat-associated protein